MWLATTGIIPNTIDHKVKVKMQHKTAAKRTMTPMRTVQATNCKESVLHINITDPRLEVLNAMSSCRTNSAEHGLQLVCRLWLTFRKIQLISQNTGSQNTVLQNTVSQNTVSQNTVSFRYFVSQNTVSRELATKKILKKMKWRVEWFDRVMGFYLIC